MWKGYDVFLDRKQFNQKYFLESSKSTIILLQCINKMSIEIFSFQEDVHLIVNIVIKSVLWLTEAVLHVHKQNFNHKHTKPDLKISCSAFIRKSIYWNLNLVISIFLCCILYRVRCFYEKNIITRRNCTGLWGIKAHVYEELCDIKNVFHIINMVLVGFVNTEKFIKLLNLSKSSENFQMKSIKNGNFRPPLPYYSLTSFISTTNV